jgi:K+-transporting ATPase ATPase C chain
MKSTTENPEIKQAHKEDGGSFFGHLWASIASTVIFLIICCGLYPLLVWGIAQLVFPNQANGSMVKKDGTPTIKDDEAVGSSLLGQNFSLPGYFHPRPSAAGNGYDPTSSGGSNLGPLSDKLINGQTQAAATQPTTAPVVGASTAPAASQPAETLAYDGLRLRTIHYAVDNNIPFKLYSVASDGSKTEVPISKFQDSQGNLNDVALVDAFPHPASDAPDRTVLIAADFGTPIPADAVTASASGLDPHITPTNAQLQAQRVADARKITVDQVKELIGQHTDGPSLGFLGDPGVNVLMLNLALDAKYPVPAAAPATQPASK